MVSILCIIYLAQVIYRLTDDGIWPLFVFKNISMVYMMIIYYLYNYQNK